MYIKIKDLDCKGVNPYVGIPPRRLFPFLLRSLLCSPIPLRKVICVYLLYQKSKNLFK